MTSAPNLVSWDIHADSDNASSNLTRDLDLVKRSKRFGGCFLWPAGTQKTFTTLSSSLDRPNSASTVGITKLIPKNSVTWD
jgi:hypothetical protein